MRSLGFVVPIAVAGLLVALPAAARKTPLPDPCPGGRFPFAGALVPGGPYADAIDVAGDQVAIASGCPAVTAKVKQTRKFTTLVARWKTCGELKRVRLVAKLDAATCESLEARFKARKLKRRTLTAAIEVPPDVFGRNTDPLPDGAVLVSAEEWADLAGQPDFRLLGPAQAAADRAAEDARTADDEQTVAGFLDAFPHLRDQYLGGVDPADPELAQGDDGNFRLSRVDRADQPQTVTTMGPKSRRSWLATLVKGFPTRENQLGIYGQMYDSVAAIDPQLVGNFVTKEQASTWTGTQLRDLVASRSFDWSSYVDLIPPPGGTPPPGFPATCGGEEGAGIGSDLAGAAVCDTPTANGLIANRVWPLKFRTTCVRSQGMRGICWAFATTAAVEVELAKKHDRWINFSEQHLVYMTKWIWYPSVYGDNGGPPLDKILETGHTLPFEGEWNYNQSSSRTSNDTTQRYADSCTGYGGPQSTYCSDTNHQGRIVCTPVLRWMYCAAVAPPVVASGFAPTRWSYIWDLEDPERALANLFWAVAIFRKPVLLAFPVTPTFDAPDADGYVTFVGAHCVANDDGTCTPETGCECDRGGHLAIITGLIDNEDLPPGAPAGDGGGYFILKNSWGHCYADTGYVYLPYTWVRLLANWAAVLDVN
jgi:hypothetical protein